LYEQEDIFKRKNNAQVEMLKSEKAVYNESNLNNLFTINLKIN